jgi:hypothetical protein
MYSLHILLPKIQQSIDRKYLKTHFGIEDPTWLNRGALHVPLSQRTRAKGNNYISSTVAEGKLWKTARKG